jgi:AcrR family transcriptional regulator
MKRTIEEKKKDILEVAIKLFAEKGYEGTTMAEIAKLANVGFGTVATYYENKENLLFKCVEEPMPSLLEAALRFDSHPQNYEEEIKRMTFHHFKLFSEHRLYLLLLIHVTAQWEKYLNSFLIANKAVKEIADKIAILVQNGQNDGKLAETDADILANSYISLLLGLFLSHTDYFPDELLKLFAGNSVRLFGLR